MEPLVSVIIPVYNVEKYLNRCVESIINQTITNIEIILVDDGSPDNCPRLCDEYSRKHSNVITIHKKNGGLASARNAGLKKATGRYIFFVDSDDWVEPQTLEELSTIAEKSKVDFVRFRPMYAGWPGIKDGTLCDFGTEEGMHEGIYSRKMISKEIYPRLFATPNLRLGVIVAAWRSLYNRNFMISNNLKFYDDVKYSEDTIFSANVVMAAESFYYLDGARYYHYFFNPSSITKSFKPDRWDSYKKLINAFENDFSDRKEYDFSDQLWLQKIYCIVSALGQKKLIENRKKCQAYCKSICNDPVTIESMKHTKLVKGNLKLKLYLTLIRFKMIFLISRI